jgi:hypothetical protein
VNWIWHGGGGRGSACLGLVLHDERCIRSMPRHQRRMGKHRHDGSLKRGCGGSVALPR